MAHGDLEAQVLAVLLMLENEAIKGGEYFEDKTRR